MSIICQLTHAFIDLLKQGLKMLTHRWHTSTEPLKRHGEEKRKKNPEKLSQDPDKSGS